MLSMIVHALHTCSHGKLLKLTDMSRMLLYKVGADGCLGSEPLHVSLGFIYLPLDSLSLLHPLF